MDIKRENGNVKNRFDVYFLHGFQLSVVKTLSSLPSAEVR